MLVQNTLSESGGRPVVAVQVRDGKGIRGFIMLSYSRDASAGRGHRYRQGSGLPATATLCAHSVTAGGGDAGGGAGGHVNRYLGISHSTGRVVVQLEGNQPYCGGRQACAWRCDGSAAMDAFGVLASGLGW